MDKQPTVFHVTHIKAGSQWVAEVLKHSAPERFVPPQPRLGHVLNAPLQAGGVYPTVYLSRPGFEALLAEAFLAATTPRPPQTFVVVRDLRDTLISLYFSLKFSHAVTNPFQQRLRALLHEASVEQGLLLLIDQAPHRPVLRELLALPELERYRRTPTLTVDQIPPSLDMAFIAQMQQSWHQAAQVEVLHLRYEDLVEDEYAAFERLMAYCEIEVPRSRLHEIVRYNSFEAVTGRPRGREDPSAHQRKGIAGDWQTYFTERVKACFKETFGEVLIETGYEQDLDW